jgi:hypothetical protein
MNVARLSAPRTERLYPQKIFLVLPACSAVPQPAVLPRAVPPIVLCDSVLWECKVTVEQKLTVGSLYCIIM